jgi:hypothetical protein
LSYCNQERLRAAKVAEADLYCAVSPAARGVQSEN